MAKDFERESLISALAYCSLRELPPEDTGEHIWIMALAKVMKADGSVSYVLVEKDDKGENRYVKDFGNVSTIRKVLAYYPYSFLKESFVPKFKTPKKDERIAYLVKFYGDKEDWSKYKTSELDEIILNLSIKNQKDKEKHG